MRVRAGSFGVVLLSVFFACGGEAPQVVTPPPLHITASPPPPAPQRARWVFATPDSGVVAKLDLGDKGTLYVGRSGRRELAKAGQMTDAATLASGDLVGVLRDPSGGFVFVSGTGATFASKDPLGALDAAHAAPAAGKGKRLYVATGKSAILAIADGKLLRSSDFGATWTPIDYAGASKPYGRAGAVALDSKGNGVLLHFPQRVFVTHDDGATWTKVGSLHLGVRSVLRDGDDRVFVRGFDAHAKLDGDALVATNDAPKPIYEAKTGEEATPSRGRDEEDAVTLVTGKRFVQIEGDRDEVRVGSAPLGEKIPKMTPVRDLASDEGFSKRVAAFGSDLVYLRADDDADATAPTTTVFRSNDYGATWKKDGQLSGAEPVWGEGAEVALGPKGWTYVTSLCPKHERGGSACARRQVRPAGAASFGDLAFVEEFEPMRFAFDEAHDKVYALGQRGGHKYLYESPLGQNSFQRTKLLDAMSYAPVAVAVDDKGVARAFQFDGAKGAWVVTRGDETTKDAKPEYLALPRGTMTFAGARGVLFAGPSEGFETADGGETWTKIATNGFAHDLACSEAGCVNGDAQRVGWDLPALHGETVSAQVELPHTTPVPPPPSPPPTEIACSVSGAGSPLTSPPGADMVDGAAADRWASIKFEDGGKTALVVGTKNAVRELPLLGVLPKPGAKAPPMETRMGERMLDDGVVVARYRFESRRLTGGGYNPVDVDLAWWSAATGRTHHHVLPKVAPFRVSRYGFSGTPEIVDGGFLFEGAPNDAAYFVGDDDKVVRVTMPAGAQSREVERLGARWLVADSLGGTVRLSASDDAGKTWKQTAWGLDLWGDVELSRAGTRATVTYGTLSAPSLLFDVDASLPDDPPAPTAISASPEPFCDAHAGRHRYSKYVPGDERSVHVRVDNKKGTDKWTSSFWPQTRVTHDEPGGKTCTSAYTMHGTDTHGGRYDYQTVFVYPEANGTWTGWRFRRGDDPRARAAFVAEPLTCKAAK